MNMKFRGIRVGLCALTFLLLTQCSYGAQKHIFSWQKLNKIVATEFKSSHSTETFSNNREMLQAMLSRLKQCVSVRELRDTQSVLYFRSMLIAAEFPMLQALAVELLTSARPELQKTAAIQVLLTERAGVADPWIQTVFAALDSEWTDAQVREFRKLVTVPPPGFETAKMRNVELWLRPNVVKEILLGNDAVTSFDPTWVCSLCSSLGYAISESTASLNESELEAFHSMLRRLLSLPDRPRYVAILNLPKEMVPISVVLDYLSASGDALSDAELAFVIRNHSAGVLQAISNEKLPTTSALNERLLQFLPTTSTTTHKRSQK